MKSLTLFCMSVLLHLSLYAQSPEMMSYQAVIRNAGDVLLANQPVGMQVSILQGSVSGMAVYSEKHSPTTNANGLISIEIGNGTVVSGYFTTIDWANGPYFIKTETDPTGGENYSITATSQLLSVPYAFHAKTAETLTGGVTETDPVFDASPAKGITPMDTARWNRKLDTETDGSVSNELQTLSLRNDTLFLSDGGFVKIPDKNEAYLGQDTLGGIVFYLYEGADGIQHGLIVSKTESTAQWQSSTSPTGANHSWDGVYNMNLMSDSPAKNWVTANFSSEWYLPSVDELSLLWHNRFHVNKGLYDSGAAIFSNTGLYWSSNEYNDTAAHFYTFEKGYTLYTSKTNTYNIRAVRSF